MGPTRPSRISSSRNLTVTVVDFPACELLNFRTLAVRVGRFGTERQRHYNGAISELLRKNRGRVTNRENASEGRTHGARTGAMIRPRLGGRDLTSNDFAEPGWYSG